MVGSFHERVGRRANPRLSRLSGQVDHHLSPPSRAALHFHVRGHAHTTVAIQGYLDELAGLTGASPAEPVVRELLERAAARLHALCGAMLFRSYPRLTRPPHNLGTE